MKLVFLILSLTLAFPVSAEVVCKNTDSSFLHNVCFDRGKQLLTLKLKSRRYTYCNVPYSVFVKLVNAPSKGEFYNAYIKGKYKCS